MTTAQVEFYADPQKIGNDLWTRAILRRKVVPEFLEGVGKVGWRRKTFLAMLNPTVQSIDLPMDFGKVDEVTLWATSGSPPPPNGPCPIPLHYIGDDGVMRLAAEEASTVFQAPTGYWIDRTQTSPNRYATVKFSYPADQQYRVRLIYYLEINFPDDRTPLELDNFIPTQFQWAFVHGLKAEIYDMQPKVGPAAQAYMISLGQERQAFGDWIEKARANKELTDQQKMNFVSV